MLEDTTPSQGDPNEHTINLGALLEVYYDLRKRIGALRRENNRLRERVGELEYEVFRSASDSQ